jgi:hypothetical protein
VNGPEAHQVFKQLRKKTKCFTNPTTGKIKNIPWNFAKFILDANGEVVIYSNPRQSLYKSIDEIEAILGLKNASEVDFQSGLNASMESTPVVIMTESRSSGSELALSSGRD